MKNISLKLVALIVLSLFTTACAETELASHAIKTSLPNRGAATTQQQGDFKVGNPYKIAGQTYVPQETYNHTETGIASWYGPQFHGKKTANGEIFDKHELTAAHRTLQMPSLVRVTNLDNGRSLIVRVNDRGPFKRGRIIDLSERAAELLGFKNQGTAKVKIQVLTKESLEIAERAKRGEDTRGTEVAMNDPRMVGGGRRIPASTTAGAREPITTTTTYQTATANPAHGESLPAADISGHMRDGNFMPDPVVKQLQVFPTSIYVQAGSFGNPENADRLAQTLQPHGQSRVYPAVVDGRQFYRVRVGPVANVDEADRLLSRVVGSGHKNAIIVVE